MCNLCTGCALCVILCFMLHETLSSLPIQISKICSPIIFLLLLLPIIFLVFAQDTILPSFHRIETKLIKRCLLRILYSSFRKENNSCDFIKKKQKIGDSIISHNHVLRKDKSSSSHKTKREYEMLACTLIVSFLCLMGVSATECTFSSSRYSILNLNTYENKQN
jgi:hypothetical protein